MANNFGNSINSNIGASNSGATNTLTITNPSNTASSQAQELITVGGTSSGDAWTQYSIGSSQSYAIGIDNSDSDILKITQAASATVNPSTATVLQQFDTSNTRAYFPIPLIALGGATQAVGSAVDLNILNTSTTAASDARINLQVSAATGGTAHLDYTGPTNNWSAGVDKADSSKYKITQGTTGSFPYSTVAMSATTAGVCNFAQGLSFDATNILASYVDWTTWTPTAFGNTTAGTTTYTRQAGYYMRIGNLVILNFDIIFTAATGTGPIQIGNLPINISTASNYFPLGQVAINSLTWPAARTAVFLEPNGATQLSIIAQGSTVAADLVVIANTTCELIGSMMYRAA